MTIFISYARRDELLVQSLHLDIERSKREVWYDRELEGGQSWWDTILANIRSCDLFLFTLSPDSITSRACRAELDYAVALGRPILPVMVRDVNVQLAPDVVGLTQILDYRERTADAAIALLMAITHSAVAGPLPDPLPPPPAAPVGDLGPLRDRVHAESLTLAEQRAVLEGLRGHADNRDELEAVVALLAELRARADIVESVGHDVDAMLLRLPAPSSPAEPTAPRPSVMAGLSPESLDLLRSLVTHIRAHHFTPVLGLGLTDSLIGPRQLLAREWSRSFEFPMARHQQEDLPQVAQFVNVMSDDATLRASLAEYLRHQLADRYPDVVANHPDGTLDELWQLAWDRLRATAPTDPHVVLASLPCPIYVTAHPANLLTQALRATGRVPTVDICRWRPDVYDWPPSPWLAEPGYTPDPDRPLVFHVFGNLDWPDSLVLTEDDYFDFLISVTEDPSLVPLPVRSALADSALLFLGFGLEDWDVRILLRSLVSQEGAHKLSKYTHVAAQLDLAESVMSPDRARRYLEKYFAKFRRPSIDIFWGSVDEFAAGLATVWTPRG